MRTVMLTVALILAPCPSALADIPDWSPVTPQRLAAKAQIEALEIEYYYRIDHGNAEAAADLYTADGFLQTGTSPPIRAAKQSAPSMRSVTRAG